MGVLLRKIGDYDEALSLSLEAADLYEGLRDTLLLGETFNNIGLIYKERNEIDSAQYYYEIALVYKEKSRNSRSLASTYVNLGLIYHEQGEYEKAEEHYRKAIDYRRAASDQFGLVSAQGNLAQLYFDTERYRDAEGLLYELLEETQKANYKPAESRTLIMLSEIEERKNNWREALMLQRRGYRIHDSLTEFNNSSEIKGLQLQFQKDQVVLDNERLRLEGEMQKAALQNETELQRVYVMLIALLVLFGSAFGLLLSPSTITQ